MLGNLAKSVFGSSNDRYVKSLDKIVRQIAGFETTITAMTLSEELNWWRRPPASARCLERRRSRSTICMPEAFATVPRSFAVRTCSACAISTFR